MMSHRRLPVRDRGSGVCAFAAGGTLRKFMSAILTHLGFNVTKHPAATKHKVASRCRLPKREPIAPDERRQTYWTSVLRKSVSCGLMSAPGGRGGNGSQQQRRGAGA